VAKDNLSQLFEDLPAESPGEDPSAVFKHHMCLVYKRAVTERVLDTSGIPKVGRRLLDAMEQREVVDVTILYTALAHMSLHAAAVHGSTLLAFASEQAGDYTFSLTMQTLHTLLQAIQKQSLSKKEEIGPVTRHALAALLALCHWLCHLQPTYKGLDSAVAHALVHVLNYFTSLQFIDHPDIVLDEEEELLGFPGIDMQLAHRTSIHANPNNVLSTRIARILETCKQYAQLDLGDVVYDGGMFRALSKKLDILQPSESNAALNLSEAATISTQRLLSALHQSKTYQPPQVSVPVVRYPIHDSVFSRPEYQSFK
jgi:hypothetical protein